MSWDVQLLFRRHAEGISRALRRRGLSPETAADLTQDTFLRLLLAAPSGKAVLENPEAYLHSIARNLRRDHERRERRAGKIFRSVDPAVTDLAAIIDPAPSVEAVIYARESLLRVARALAELPERQRQAFALHRIEGLVMAEIGARLGISTSGAWGLVRDAYTHLDERLGDLRGEGR